MNLQRLYWTAISYGATLLPRLAGPLFPDLLWRQPVPEDERTVFLTFDDGPTRAMTDPILELLARYEARATCFLIGARAADDPGRVRAIQEAGHTIGQHTFTHPDAWQTPAAALREDLDRGTKTLEDLTGTAIRCMRPPYGNFTTAMRRWCQEHGQQVVMWDVMPGDYLPGATQPLIEQHTLRFLRPGSIIVLHDNPIAPATPAALETILRQLTSQGWRFEAL